MLNKSGKILFLTSELTRGGTERATANVANVFSEAGMDVSIILLEGTRVDYPVTNNISLIKADYSSRGIKRIFDKRTFLRRTVKRLKPDCIVTMNRSYGTLVTSGVVFHNKILASERFSPREHLKEHGPLMRILSLIVYICSKRVVFQTPECMEYYRRLVSSKFVIIPNVVASGLPQYTWSPDYRKITFIGRLEDQKNVPLMISSFSAFNKTHCDYSLEIYGDGSQKSKLIKMAETQGIADKVHFHPFTSNIHKELLDVAIVVSTSEFEGIQNSLLEALAMGIPCVATDCAGGGARLLLGRNNEYGFLVPRQDANAVAGAMSLLADNQTLAREYSSKAAEIRRLYSNEAISKQWLEVINNVLEIGK